MIQTTYAGVPLKPDTEAQIALVLVPYGKFGSQDPQVWPSIEDVTEACSALNAYDVETNLNVASTGMTMQYFSDLRNPSALTEELKMCLERGQFVGIVGADHGITPYVTAAFAESYENLSILQIDARMRFLKQKHGSEESDTADYLSKLSQRMLLVQVGIRDALPEEKLQIQRQNVFFAHEMRKNPLWIDEAIECLTREVFVIIDLEVLDLSAFRSGDFQSPNGMHWSDLYNFLRKLSKRRHIVGFEIVGVPKRFKDAGAAYAVASLKYKLLNYIYKRRLKTP